MRSLTDDDQIIATGIRCSTGNSKINKTISRSIAGCILDIIDGKYETEASGGINLNNIEAYAATGVDFISSGAIIHQAKSLDLSLKAVID